MHEMRIELKDLALKAKELHLKERDITLESVLLIGKLVRMNAASNMGMTNERFAAAIALTLGQYWKRAQAAQVIRFYPQALDMLTSGETNVSCLALLAAKITQANSDVLLNGIKNKSKREVEGLMSRVLPDGCLIDREEEFEFHFKLRERDAKKLNRAREILAHGGRVPSLAEIVAKALTDLIKRRDPLKKAERAMARKAKSSISGSSMSGPQPQPPLSAAAIPGESRAQSPASEVLPPPPTLANSPGRQFPSHLAKEKLRRAVIPAATKHEVVFRDHDQCTWTYPDGSRCPETMMLEFDHLHMHCRGGSDESRNLRLRCRFHNNFAAAQALGPEWMERWQKPRGANGEIT